MFGPRFLQETGPVLMNFHTLIKSVPTCRVPDLYMALVDFANRVDDLRTPADVLDALHVVSATKLPLNVFGAARFLLNLGASRDSAWKSCFLHRSVPDGFWEEYTALAKRHFTPAIFLARSSLGSFTWTETTRGLEPIGADRWSFELGLKYGMRDGLTYGVGGRGWLASGPARSCRMFSRRLHEYPFVLQRASLRYG